MTDVCCYILFSQTLNKFYIGACQDSLTERIVNHNNHDYGNHRFTAAANDWELFLKIEVSNFAQAIRLERKIKSMKSSTFIQNLANYPELVQKITSETTG